MKKGKGPKVPRWWEVTRGDVPTLNEEPLAELFDVQPVGQRFFGEAIGTDTAGRVFTEGGWCGTRYREP